MAKFCNVCQQHYADHEERCPHCAASIPLAEDALSPWEGDSAIDLSNVPAATAEPASREPVIGTDSAEILAALLEDVPPAGVPAAIPAHSSQPATKPPAAIPLANDARPAPAPAAIPVSGGTPPKRRPSEVDFDMPLGDPGSQSGDLFQLLEVETPAQPESGIDLNQVAAELKFDTTQALRPDEPLAAPVATPILATPASPVAPTMPSKVAAKPPPPDLGFGSRRPDPAS